MVGYDNWEVFAADCRPPLTTVDLNLQQLGATAVEYLFAALDGQQASGVIRQPCRLVVRDSTRPVPHGSGSIGVAEPPAGETPEVSAPA